MVILEPASWAISMIILFVVAKTNFDRPPTRRSGTTWFLFSCGLVLYYALTLAIWTAVTIAIKSGSPILNILDITIPKGFDFALPIIAMLFVVLTSLNKYVAKLDQHARKYCEKLASTPKEKDNLVFQITRQSVFGYDGDTLPALDGPDNNIHDIVSAASKLGIKEDVIDFHDSNSLRSLFTKIFAIYYHLNLRQRDLPKRYRSVIASHMDLFTRVERGFGQYVEEARNFFQMGSPKDEYNEIFRKSSERMYVDLCDLLARSVLYVERRQTERYRKLKEFGFEIESPRAMIGLNQYFSVLAASLIFFTVYFLLVPRPEDPEAGNTLLLFLALSVSIEVSVSTVVGVTAAYSAVGKADALNFPPVAKFFAFSVGASLIAAAVNLAIFAAHQLPDLGVSAFPPESVYSDRWPWRLMPLFMCLGVAIACTLVGKSKWSTWVNVAVGFATVFAFCSLGMWFVELVFQRVLEQAGPGWKGYISALLIGGGVGAMVAPLFKLSIEQEEEQAKQDAELHPHQA